MAETRSAAHATALPALDRSGHARLMMSLSSALRNKPLPGSRFPRSIADDLWIVIWLSAALFAIFQTGPMPLYSTRTLGVAWEMWSSGQFLVPCSNGEPYSHKVPLLFWLIHAGWAIGGVGDVWPRILQVALGLGVLLLARRLARVLFAATPLVGTLTPWLLAAFGYAFLFGLQIMYEVLLCVCVLGAFNALVGRDPAQRPRFILFALAVAAGLLAKGPVMLVHVVFPYLLGPLWHPWAAAERARWYCGGGLALLGGCAVLLAWAIPAAIIGGEGYRNELFFMQTAGRVIDSFDHARPWWWYLRMLPAMLIPWLLWPRAWQAIVMGIGAERGTGLHFIACWLVPVVVAFSLISGKQIYYLLPEATAGAMLLAIGFARLDQRARKAPLVFGTWPLALCLLAGALALFLLPGWIANGRVTSVWYVDLSTASVWFVVIGFALGLAVLSAPRADGAAVMRVATVSILTMALFTALFAQTLWPRFDVRPAARYVAALQAQGIEVAHHGIYHTQFQFAGRLVDPLIVLPLHGYESWLDAHPDARVVRYQTTLGTQDLDHAELVQPLRSDWLLIERAGSWAARLRGETVPVPETSALRHPPAYWPYRRLDTLP